MSESGTLENKKRSGFVRTPPQLAVRIGKYLLWLPSEEYAVFDPTAGEGDFFYACAPTAQAHLFGAEISAERAAVCRQRWPKAQIVTAAVECVHVPAGSMSLVLANPPYFFQNGKRAEYRIIADAGEALMPGGIMVAIMPARSAWDGLMINHWLKWYDQVRVWKFPDRLAEDDETTFEDFTQIVVIGIRRAEPTLPTDAEKRRLSGYQWKAPKKAGQSGWKHGAPPPELPDTPCITDPYHVPACRSLPRLVVRNADEATLLYALDKSGAHLAPTWQSASSWSEEGYLGPPAMPYTGDAHIAAEVMIGGLDGEIVFGPGSGPDAEPHLFTAFVGKEWMQMPVDDELVEKLREEGCIRVEMRQLQDKPILGVLNLSRGTTRYYQGEEVFQFLQPWIATLASRVVAKRQPLYRLDPQDWELRVLSQFGNDKRLPKAQFSGLAVPQLHRVFAMGRSLDVKGRTAIQGEPGTGKTRLAGGTAKRQAYLWRNRTTEFAHSSQPAWVRGLRRAWLKNETTLELLGLEPIYGRHLAGERGGKGRIVVDPTARQIVAYREKATGRLITPEDAGPKALPVLVTTPLKVTKEYGKEIKAAFPQAEVMHIESHRDIGQWLQRCATSRHPVVFGIFSHSLTRAFGREWREVVREKVTVTRTPVLDPDPDVLPLLDPVYEERGRRKLVGFRFKDSGELLVKERRMSLFYCVDCGGRIDAVPGKVNQPDEKEEKQQKGKAAKAKKAEGDEEQDKKEPVTSRTWFQTKQRWCKCVQASRGKERIATGRPALRAPLWQDDRTKATNKKHPQATFAQWTAAMAQLSTQATHAFSGASTQLLAEHVRRNDGLLAQLVTLALGDSATEAELCALVARADGAVAPLRETLTTQRAQLAATLVALALRDRNLLESLVQPAVGDEALLARLVDIIGTHEPSCQDYLQVVQQERAERQAARERVVAEALQTDMTHLTAALQKLLRTAEAQTFIDLALSAEPVWKRTVAAYQARQNEQALVRLLTRLAQRHDAVLAAVEAFGLRDEPFVQTILAAIGRKDPAVAQLLEGEQRDRAALVSLVGEVALQNAEISQSVVAATLLPPEAFASLLVRLACRDRRALECFAPTFAAHREDVEQVVAAITAGEAELAGRVRQAVRRDSSRLVLHRLIACTREQMDWQPVFFRAAFDQAHSSAAPVKRKQVTGLGIALDGTICTPARGVRLSLAEGGPITVEEADRMAAQGYDPVPAPDGTIVGYQMGKGGRLLVPIYGIHSRRIVGYAHEGKLVTRATSFDFRQPPADSFSPYHYLYRFFRGCVALSVVDESHNGRGRKTDIAHSHHFAMLAAQMRQLTSGTHFGGDILGFYHYWFRYNPRFWLSRGYGWNEPEKALADYGVIQEWTKEYESDARKGSGQTDEYVSTIPAPGLSANMIPGLLEDLTYLTVLDVGAHMPPKRELPKGISMKDEGLEQATKEAEQRVAAAKQAVTDLQAEQTAIGQTEACPERDAYLAEIATRLQAAQQDALAAEDEQRSVRHWVEERDLEAAYTQVVKDLEEAAETNTAARLAKGTVPRWFAALPCDSPFEVYSTQRGDWGDKSERELVIRTPVLTWNHLYPIERYYQQVAREQVEAGRRVMFYFEQSTIRSMAKRLEWVLKEFHPWTLPHNVEAEDRQQAILDAVARGHKVVIVPYRKVNEGLNLQTAIDTIVWAELAMNLFFYTQASQRAWRLGKENEVQIIIPYYIGSVAHKQVRRLGERDGAAAAFAGEPAKGGLVHHVGADQTTLARLSAQIEQGTELDWMPQPADDSAEIEAAFARRNAELAEALRLGRQWFGLSDSLPERFSAVMMAQHPNVWATMPEVVYLPEVGLEALAPPVALPEPADGSATDGVGADHAPTEAARVASAAHAKPVSAPSSESLPTLVAVSPITYAADQITFGNEADIERVRRRRRSGPRRTPKPANPVQVKHIPAVVESILPVSPPPDSGVMLSIWDLAG